MSTNSLAMRGSLLPQYEITLTKLNSASPTCERHGYHVPMSHHISPLHSWNVRAVIPLQGHMSCHTISLSFSAWLPSAAPVRGRWQFGANIQDRGFLYTVPLAWTYPRLRDDLLHRFHLWICLRSRIWLHLSGINNGQSTNFQSQPASYMPQDHQGSSSRCLTRSLTVLPSRTNHHTAYPSTHPINPPSPQLPIPQPPKASPSRH